MRLVFLLLGLACAVPYGDAEEQEAATALPADVVEFKERRDLCDHFRGEEPYDEERRKFLEESLNRYCAGTDQELAALKARHKGDEAVQKMLTGYEIRIESDDRP